jgi:hypothetical protein
MFFLLPPFLLSRPRSSNQSPCNKVKASTKAAVTRCIRAFEPEAFLLVVACQRRRSLSPHSPLRCKQRPRLCHHTVRTRPHRTVRRLLSF